MPVDQAYAAHAMAREFLDDVAQRGNQRRAVEAGGSRQMVAAARFLVRFVAVGEGRGDQGVDATGDTSGELDGQQDIDIHRHVVAVLLHRADRQQDRHGAVTHARVIVRPGHLGSEDGLLRHGHLPFWLMGQ